MIEMKFEVIIRVRDDDQTDPEMVAEILEHNLRKMYDSNMAEFEAGWPEGWSVRHTEKEK